MEAYDYIKHISIEDFKKLDVNQITYVQMNNGEIFMIDHPYMYKQDNQTNINIENNTHLKNEKNKLTEDNSKKENKNKKRKKRKKNKNKNKKNETDNLQKKEAENYNNDNKTNNYDDYDNYYNYNYDNYPTEEEKYTLPKEYFEYDYTKYRPRSVEIKNKGIKLFGEEWKDLHDYDFNERIKFYDEIPKKAKYWENESYDPTKSLFQSKRIEKITKNNFQNMYNYMPIKQDSFSDEEDYKSYEEDNHNNESQKSDNYYNISDNNNNNIGNNNAGYPINQITNQKQLYELAFGPQFAQYFLGQQSNPYQQNNNNEAYYPQNNNNTDYYYHTNNNNYDNYDQYQYYYNNTNYNDYYNPNSYYYDEEENNYLYESNKNKQKKENEK